MTTMRLAHDDDLTTRFARDAVPAIDGLYRHAFTDRKSTRLNSSHRT